MIKNIIFDVGMVLVDFCWQKVLEDLGFEGDLLKRVAAATVGSSAWGEYDRSRKSDEEILAGLIANDPELEPEIRLFWDHNRETIRLYPYAESWVREFKEKGYRCYILSNYSRRTYELTREERPFEELMDGVLFSFQVQQVKPERAIYETFLKRFGLVPEECVFLDDSPKNIAAARELGIYGVQFTTREAAVEELRKLGVE